jgi:glycosyltransferase involved in cell wall biosynthesis
MVSVRYAPLSGGAENQAHLLAQALQRRGHEIVVLSAQFPGLPRFSRIDGISVVRLPYPGRLPIVGRLVSTTALLLLVVAWIARWRSRFDIVHAHIGNPFSAVAVVGAQIARRPSILKIATSGAWSDLVAMRSPTSGLLGRLTLPALMLADRFVVLNVQSERELVKLVGAGRVRRISNGVALSSTRWSLESACDVVFAAGRLDKQKGFDILVEACAAGGPEVVIAGEGPERAALMGLADRLGTRLRLLGQIDPSAMRTWLLRARLVAVPSRAEGMSNVLLEALALGCPIVASSIPGNADLIETGQSGCLVPPDDPHALRAAIDSLLSQPTMSQTLAHGGAEYAAREFSMDRVASRYETLYAELLEP